MWTLVRNVKLCIIDDGMPKRLNIIHRMIFHYERSNMIQMDISHMLTVGKNVKLCIIDDRCRRD